jgi:hypothetical protein
MRAIAGRTLVALACTGVRWFHDALIRYGENGGGLRAVR